ncbi:MAG: hypothetical protein IPN84_00400 [Sphingomonadales bacterium]|nr:hypothetical protein [Sphingomonadales bacterium]
MIITSLRRRACSQRAAPPRTLRAFSDFFIELLACGEDDNACVGAKHLQGYLHKAVAANG